MQRARFLSILAFVISIFAPLSISGQYTTAELGGKEVRPFDFNDRYYSKNGVDPKKIIDRRTGLDKYSVFDFIDSEIHRNVRITGTWPMTDTNGEMMFVAPLGTLPSDGFTRDEKGVMAMSIAHRYPYFVFPSSKFENKFRQAGVVETADGYLYYNPVGLSVIVSVDFTEKGLSKDGRQEVENLLGKNGKTLDGTYAIHRVSEIDYLNRRGLIKQTFWNTGKEGVPAYQINRTIENPVRGAISPDANLIMIVDQDQKPLSGEMKFLTNFECLQKSGNWCG